MTVSPRMQTGNRILDRLLPHAYDRLVPNLEEVEIKRAQVMHSPGEEIKHLYFPVNAMISITVTMNDGRVVETGAAGNREVVGINAFMGGQATTQTTYIGQVPGKAIRIAAPPLQEEFDRNTSLRTLLLRYTQAFIAQISQNTGCNRLHLIDSRCARWLLEIRDRVSSDKFHLIQEFMAEMLGANRTSVTFAMGDLRDRGLVEYTRGNISLLDVPGLEKQSCECYFVLRGEYERLMGPLLSQAETN